MTPGGFLSLLQNLWTLYLQFLLVLFVLASFFDKVEWFCDRYKGFINKLYSCLRFLYLILNVLEKRNFMRMFVSCFDKVEWFFSGKKFSRMLQNYSTLSRNSLFLLFVQLISRLPNGRWLPGGRTFLLLCLSIVHTLHQWRTKCSQKGWAKTHQALQKYFERYWRS